MTSQDGQQQELLTVKEVQKYLRIGRDKAYILVKSGNFPCMKIGNTYRIPKDTFMKWINHHSKHNSEVL